MKPSLKICAASLLLFNTSLFAANPIPGIYLGIFIGGSYAPSTDITFLAPTNLTSSCLPPTSTSSGCGTTTTGELTYSGFGAIGGQIGYRIDQFRIEVEPMVNYNPYQKITVGTTRYNSPKSSTGLRLKGSTTTGAIMLNGYYDFYTPGSSSDFAPYLGAGIGYARVNNSMRFYYNNETLQYTKIVENNSSPAAQGIIGAAYFLDDYTWFGLDYRYLTTKTIDILNSRVQIHSINLSFNGSICL
ncbi:MULTISPECIES: outer membrane protein [Legionella]|uniref:P44/Msp2 family outer membrane protein n=1 Tax=Legionella septentrionalis TaxID=2498109 RepID=A0A3S0VN53_9GAMM|nr:MULTISPECIES: outer membrane beta-barrel protein [Legionella]MCP0913606.1 outer membrane beta-barrel protein [Legionella sp. 27cVA30]RUQ88207.1 P44/Msp2 family outer membrane protein [Legionella septentrionalis]RUQ95041.1 P44/Msp2 family outer membrane protein [Legionella septentrionalis]RUR08799.1 P44/Msp2 family outer membrane protein [Legionella septentrionalis]RUR15963.1 P44/Msp2 family outer membrane protein [Legionella septentrionalis]